MYITSESAYKSEHAGYNYFKIDRGVKQGDGSNQTLYTCFINDVHDVFD
mgnify:CR=1 FL=1